MIEIKSSINIPYLDELYSKLAKHASDSEKISLKLPKTISKRNFGVVFSLIQFVSTWVRNPLSGALILPVETETEAMDFLENEYVYPCVVMCWEKPILNSTGDNIKTILKKPSQEYFRKMDFFENKERDSIPVFCFDHDLSNRGKSRVFYGENNKLLNEASMDFVLHPAFEKLSNHLNKHVFKTSIRKELGAFYGIISELFTNTHEHARTNEKGFNLYPNIRSMYIKFHKSPVKTYLETYSELPGLTNFFNSEFKLNDKNELYLIEFSFLDSGPGLLKRYTGQTNIEVSILQEIDVIKQCLCIHNTSSTTLNKENKGYGLDRMLQILNLKGFVRIKSGRADVFRDMRNKTYTRHSSPSEIDLYDLKNNSNENFTINEWAEGTLISILYPLDFIPYE